MRRRRRAVHAALTVQVVPLTAVTVIVSPSTAMLNGRTPGSAKSESTVIVVSPGKTAANSSSATDR